ncbi:hypothetical protein Tco_1359987 [Tanacetum coccineum]
MFTGHLFMFLSPYQKDQNGFNDFQMDERILLPEYMILSGADNRPPQCCIVRNTRRGVILDSEKKDGNVYMSQYQILETSSTRNGVRFVDGEVKILLLGSCILVQLSIRSKLVQGKIVQDINSSAQQDAMILSVFEQLSNQVTNCNKINKDNLIANESLSAELKRYKEWDKNAQFADFEKEINYLKQTLSKQSKEKELLTKTFNVFKNESKEKEVKNTDKEIALEKKVKELDNIVCKMGQSAQTVHMLTKPQVF